GMPMSNWRRTALLSGAAAAALLALLLLSFPVRITNGAGSLRCDALVPSLLGQSMSGCAESAAWNLRIALITFAGIAVTTVAVTSWEPRTPKLRIAVAALLYTAAGVALLFVLMVYALAP
ncbi:MAG TPA: hypothetical protein VGW38_22705, partial [Chloroflexota bacterium]|nr:hypothetical protein [Chloroflexota bacterium]